MREAALGRRQTGISEGPPRTKKEAFSLRYHQHMLSMSQRGKTGNGEEAELKESKEEDF